MADSDDEGGGAIRFANDADFEGGTYGEDGEFYYEYQRVGKTQTKEDAIYGVFGDDYGSGRGGLGSRGGAGSSITNAGLVGFVSSGILKPGEQAEEEEARLAEEEEKKKEEEQKQQQQKAEQEAEDGVAVGLKRALDRRREQQRGGKRKEEQEETAPSKKKKVDAPKFDKDFGKWQKTTSGFGMKYLMKFQFKGRLGKNESGVANPVIPKMRPKGEGIAYGGRSELNESEVKNRDDIGMRNKKTDSKAVKEAKQPASQNWKKKAPKVKHVYKTAAQVRAEAGGGTAVLSDLILDMRGPTTRMASLKDLKTMEQVQEEASAGEEAVGTLPELAYNLRQLVQMTEASIHDLDRSISTYKDSLLALNAEKKRLDGGKSSQATKLAEMEAVAELLGRCQTRLEETKGRMPNMERLSGLADVWEQIGDKYPDIYVQHNLQKAAAAMAFPLFSSVCKSWTPVLTSLLPMHQGAVPDHRKKCLKTDEDVCNLLVRWRGLLLPNGEPTENTDDNKGGIGNGWGSGRKARRGNSANSRMGVSSLLQQDTTWEPGKGGLQSHTEFDKLLDDSVMPRVQMAVSSQWQVKDFRPILHLLKMLRPALTRQAGQKFMNELVVPKLKLGVDQWNPRLDPTPIDSWVHPWLSDIPPETMQQIYSAIRHKLGRVLEHWHPSDASALGVVTPWKDVWRAADMQMFLARSIVPKLRQTLSAEFTVNPQHQHIDPFRWVLRWEGMLDQGGLFGLLNDLFWPKWFHALYTWLKASPEFDQVTRWYLGWKGEFSEEMADTPYIKTMFNKGLDLMNLALEDGEMEPFMDRLMSELRGVPVPASPLVVPVQAVPTQPPTTPPSQLGNVTAKDFLEQIAQIAAVNNLEWLPNSRRALQQGKQVYFFGKVSVYVDKSVLYALETDMTGGIWRPISLPALLQRAQALAQQDSPYFSGGGID
eukprot:gb/GEZN01001449.1/.p1 GENE.gb/GEZN01001449.1/~~gb/GEZN01001449.1/.p1  ORF type:complete len:934 (+),score=209.60 gb/GEZN01001449.1/:82-2883(+)